MEITRVSAHVPGKAIVAVRESRRARSRTEGRLVAAAATACGGMLFSLFVVMSPTSAAASPLNDCHSSDNGDPKLTSISLSPDVVDVRSAPARVEITATAKDTGGPGPASGVRGVSVEMQDPGDDFTEIHLTRDASSGAWTGFLTVPRGTAAGRLRISQAFVQDQLRQLKWYGPEDTRVSTVAGVHAITVKSLSDPTPPKLTSFTFTPGSVNTTHHVRHVLLTARAHDPQTGVTSVSAVLTGPRGGHATFAELRRVAGSADTYRGRARIDRFVRSGRWRVAAVGLQNGAGGFAWISYARLGKLGFKRSLRVSSGQDRSAPSLRALRRTPSVLDVRGGDRVLTVTARLKDVGAGIRSADASFDARGHTPTIPLHLVAGNRHHGTWRGHVTVSRCHATAGTWRMSVEATDRRGNDSFFAARHLTRRGLPTTVHVKALPPARPPHVEVARYFVPATGHLTLEFARTVNGIDSTSARVFEDSADETPVGMPSAGVWTCRDRTAAVTSCASGRVRSAVFRPDARFASDRDYFVELNPEHSLQITDFRGNPYDRNMLFFHVGAR